MDYFIDRAAEKGIYIGDCCSGGRTAPPNETAFDTNSAFNCGRFLGLRYVNHPNIIWVMSGDGPVDNHGLGHVWQAMVHSIRSGDGGHPSIESFGGGADTALYQFYHDSNRALCTGQYLLAPAVTHLAIG
jgi:hypothetical protein